MPRKRRSSHQPNRLGTSSLQYVGLGGDQDRADLLERLPDAFVSVDQQWRFTYINHVAEALSGKSREELLGRNAWEAFPVPTDSSIYRNAHEAMNRQSILEFSEHHPLLDKWFAVRLYPFQDGLYGFFQDITERKQAEDQLQFHMSTAWNTHKSIIVTDLHGKIIYWNEGACRLFGYSAQEALGNTPALLYPRFKKRQLASDLEQIRNGEDYKDLWQGQRKDGSTIWVDIKTTLLRDPAGKAIGYIGTAQEASAQKLTEEQFLYYVRVAQNQLDAVIATDTNYNIFSWNEAAEKLYGWKQEEVLGKFVDDILCTTYFSTTGLEASSQLLSRGYWKGKVVQRRKDGAQILILASVSVIRDEAGKMIGAVAANRNAEELEDGTSNESDFRPV